MRTSKIAILSIVLALTAVAASAANVAISGDITTSQHWTANNVYNLVGQVYVKAGATLTIDAGTWIKSIPADQGALAICRGAKIYANGTAAAPVVFTSTNDPLDHWTAGTGEWGNLTIMGNALVSEYSQAAQAINGHANSPYADGNTWMIMEGLDANDPNDLRYVFGGNNDNDDSGALHFVSSRRTAR